MSSSLTNADTNDCLPSGSLNDVSWYGSAYLLTVTAFQPGFGNLYRYFNAKTVYLVSLFLFESKSHPSYVR